MATVLDSCDWNELRTNGEQIEIAPGIRVSFESRPKKCGEFTVEELRPIAEILGAAIKSVKIGRPILPMGEMVYFLAAAEGHVKIGYTTNLTSRVCDIQTANPLPLRLLAYVSGHRGVEREYHRRFAADRLHGEWFTLTPEIEAEIARLNEMSKAAQHPL